MEKDILKEAKALQEKVVAWRRDFHAHPEIGFHEERTPRIVAEELDRIGYRVRRGVGKFGVTGDLDVPGAKGRVLLRADMDALPLPDLTGDPFASQNPGVCHACGHDAHTAMLLGAAELLMARKKDLKTSVRLMFQHAEEANPGGAVGMVEDGCVEGVDAAFALHVATFYDSGKWALRPGPMLASVDRVTITVKGKGGHAADPDRAIDPMVISAQLILALQTVMSRRIRPHDVGVLSLCAVHGGTVFNIIPDSITLLGTIRTHSQAVRDKVKTLIHEICEGVARANGGAVDIVLDGSYPATINDPAMTEYLRSTAGALFGAATLVEMEKEFGGEDFSYVLEKVPGALVFLGCRNEEKKSTVPHHNSMFRIDEDVLWEGVAMYAALALRRNH